MDGPLSAMKKVCVPKPRFDREKILFIVYLNDVGYLIFEVVWDYVRCLKDGECISSTGTHLGHNLPDGKGNRYCINLVSVAGEPDE